MYDPAKYRRWYEANRARKIAQSREWVVNNADRRREWLKEYYASGRNAAQCRRYLETHREENRVACRRRYARNASRELTIET